MKKATTWLQLALLSALGTLFLSGSALSQSCDGIDGFNCTAGDVEFTDFDIIDITPLSACSAPGDLVEVTLTTYIVATANERYDIGFWVGLDGVQPNEGSASCYHDFLSPQGDPIDPNSGVGPYGELEGDPADVCGDIEQGITNAFDMQTIQIACFADEDGDGVNDLINDNGNLQMPICASWDNNSNSTCTGLDDAVPGTPSKCNCPEGGVEIPVSIDPMLDLVKKANGLDVADLGVITGPTPVVYSFDVSNTAAVAGADLTNVMLTDASVPSCAEFVGFTTSGLAPTTGPTYTPPSTITADWAVIAPGEMATIEAEFDFEKCPTSPQPDGYVNTASVVADQDTDDDDSATVILDNDTLPIQWSSLNVAAEDQSLTVNWTTSMELNVSSFEIQAAAADGQFASLAHVDAKGNTETGHDYSFVIADLAPNVYQVRIMSLDNDGSTSYSPVVEVQTDTPGSFVLDDIYPNPFNPMATVSFAVTESVPTRIELYTANGRFVQTLFQGTPPADQMQSVQIDGSGLASGLYVVRLIGPGFVGSKQVMLIK